MFISSIGNSVLKDLIVNPGLTKMYYFLQINFKNDILAMAYHKNKCT